MKKDFKESTCSVHEAILGLGQKATKQQRFWKFLEVKLGQPASVYLPYLRPVLRRDARALDRSTSAACLDSIADLMLELEKVRKRRQPALALVESKRPKLKHQAPPAPAAPQTPLFRQTKAKPKEARKSQAEENGVIGLQ